MLITLPWPDKGLSPNARLHWAPKAKLKAEARTIAGWTTIELLRGQSVAATIAITSPDKIPMTITFYPPDKRLRDDDNMVGSFKSYRDGIADALGVDDRRFKPHYYFEDAEKPGRIEVRFGGAL
jgi:crossover junction endodeoxyribonuclease RusA